MLIGISGKKRTGKDTVGAMVVEWLRSKDFTATKAAFADNLREEVARATGVSPDQFEVDKDRWRPILQWWGVEYRRYFNGEDYWIKQMTEKLLAMEEQVVVLTDVRFRDEADYVNRSGGHVLRVERETGLQDSHSSETDLDSYEEFSDVIRNDGSLEDLERKVFEYLDGLGLVDKHGWRHLPVSLV